MMSNPWFSRTWALFTLGVLGLAPGYAHAQPAGAEGENFLYQVESGDTLIDLAKRYTDNASNWTKLQSLNGVNEPTALPIAKLLRIPFSLIPELPAPAKVIHIKGQVSANGAALKQDSEVGEGDTVITGADGFVTLHLVDQSSLSVPSSSQLIIKRLRAFKGTGLADSVLQIHAGEIESEVAPGKAGVGRFEVRTPVTVTGVRGTRLRVRANPNGSQSEVIHGRANLKSTDSQQASIKQGQGAATSASGQFLGVRPLLPAPELEPISRGGSGWVARFAPVPGAQAYLVQVADDEAGTQLISSKRFASPEVSFHASGTGTFYARVRGIDADGVMGEDAVQPFPGQPALHTAFDLPVSTGFGDVVTLTDY